MMELALKILLGLYILQALVKFFMTVIPYPVRIKRTAAVHRSCSLKVFDDVLLALMAVFVVLLTPVGMSTSASSRD